MRQQAAHTVIALPMGTIEQWLEDVESWPTFLVGLQSVERLGHERYRFRLADGRDRRDVVVCVRHLPAAHRFSWRALEGPGYWGEVQLSEVDERHTGVQLTIAAHPGTLWAGLAEMTMPRMQRAAHDLRKLEQRLTGTTG